MQVMISVSFVLFLLFSSSSADWNDEVCPNTNMWFVRGKDGNCECGSNLDGIVQCDTETKELSVIDCYCLTYHSTSDKMFSVVGRCFFNCNNLTTDPEVLLSWSSL